MNLDSLTNNLGYIYWTEADGITVVQNLPNDCEGLLASLKDALNKAPVGPAVEAVGEIEITSATGDNITFCRVNAREQISGSVATTLGDTEQTARDLRDAINAFPPTIGPFYTATANGSKVILHAPVGTGPSVNGDVVSIIFDGASTATTVDMNGATDGNEIVSECANRRYFYDADFGPTDCSGSGTAIIDDVSNAREITAALVKRGLENRMISVDENVSAVSDNVLEYSRVAQIQRVTANLPGAGSEELHNIIPDTFVEDDMIYLSGASGAKAVTLKDGIGNIVLTEGADFVTSQANKAIILQLRYTPTGPRWAEVARGSIVDTIPNDSIKGAMLEDASVGTAKIASLAVVSDKIADGAIIEQKLATDSVSTVKIQDDAVTNDKIGVDAVQSAQIQDNAVISSKILDGAVTNQKIADASISANKLDAETQLVTLQANITAETGEQGEYQIPVGFKCDVVEIISRVYGPVAATDNWTIQPANGAGNMDVTVTHLAGAAFGDTQSVVPTVNTEVLAGGVIKLTSAKVTAGGKANIFAKVRRKV
jgi:hypothetical protein